MPPSGPVKPQRGHPKASPLQPEQSQFSQPFLSAPCGALKIKGYNKAILLLEGNFSNQSLLLQLLRTEVTSILPGVPRLCPLNFRNPQKRFSDGTHLQPWSMVCCHECDYSHAEILRGSGKRIKGELSKRCLNSTQEPNSPHPENQILLFHKVMLCLPVQKQTLKMFRANIFQHL